MRTSDSTNEIDAAVAAMQGELPSAPKDKENPFFKSMYADFLSCKNAARPAMSKNGLAVVQGIMTNPIDGLVGIETRLSHKSGQWILSEAWCKPKSMLPQDVGSATTYLKRYAFSAMVGLVAADDDDDGNQSQGNNDRKNDEVRVSKGTPKIYESTDADKRELKSMMVKAKIPENLWGDVSREMMNKAFSHLATIIPRYVP